MEEVQISKISQCLLELEQTIAAFNDDIRQASLEVKQAQGKLDRLVVQRQTLILAVEELSKLRHV